MLIRGNVRANIAAPDSRLASPFPTLFKMIFRRIASCAGFPYVPSMKNLLPVLLAGSFLVSCVPSTPQARIEKNPQAFAALGKKDQELVKQGLISRGMSPDAVKLAWGEPAQRFEGSRKFRRTERWDYSGSKPVYSTGFYGGYGYGWYSPYGYGRYSSLGYGLGPEVSYIPYRVASVWFVENRVESWEREHR